MKKKLLIMTPSKCEYLKMFISALVSSSFSFDYHGLKLIKNKVTIIDCRYKPEDLPNRNYNSYLSKDIVKRTNGSRSKYKLLLFFK